MKTITLIALAKMLTDQAKPLKKNLQPGEHPVDEIVTVRVVGNVVKLVDTEQTPTCEIPLLNAFALFVEKSGVVGPNIAKMLGDCMTEAILYGKDRVCIDDKQLPDKTAADIMTERMKDIDAAMAQVRKTLDDLPKTPKSGATTVKVGLEVAEFKEAA